MIDEFPSVVTNRHHARPNLVVVLARTESRSVFARAGTSLSGFANVCADALAVFKHEFVITLIEIAGAMPTSVLKAVLNPGAALAHACGQRIGRADLLKTLTRFERITVLAADEIARSIIGPIAITNFHAAAMVHITRCIRARNARLHDANTIHKVISGLTTVNLAHAKAAALTVATFKAYRRARSARSDFTRGT